MFKKRIRDPLIALLKEGLVPEKLALSVALGLVMGVFPVIGSTTLLCYIVAHHLKLNHFAIQTINSLVYPLHFALLIPFFQLGEWLFRVPASLLTISQVKNLIMAGPWIAVQVLWATTWHAVVAWVLVAPLCIWLIYRLTLPVFRRWSL